MRRAARIILAFMVSGSAWGQTPCDGLRVGVVDMTTVPTNNSLGTPLGATVLNGIAYFNASRPGEGYSLWRSDGTEQGTTLAVFHPGGSSVGVQLLGANDDALYFVTNNSPRSLWRTDGTEAGTVMLEAVYTPVAVNTSSSFFIAAGTGALYTTDGLIKGVKTVGGMGQVSVISTVQPYRLPAPARLGGRMVYAIHEDAVDASTLWISDGSAGGTVQLGQWSGAGTTFAQADSLTTANGRVFFVVGDAANRSEVWSTDGTPGGAIRHTNYNPGLTGGSVFMGGAGAGRVWFDVQNDAINAGAWCDGTTVGLLPINVRTGLVPNPAAILDLGDGRVVFAGSRNGFNVEGLEPYVSDGTAAGTHILADIVPGAGDSMYVSQQGGVVIGGGTTGLAPRALFCVDTNGVSAADGEEIWVTDGTPGGTQRVCGRTASSGWGMTTDGTKAYFPNATELWVSDGTPEGTHAVSTPPGAPALISASGAQRVGNIMMFAASDSLHGREPWATDGTEANTRLVKDIAGGSISSNLNGLIAWDGAALVLNGSLLKRWDGRHAPTTQAAVASQGAGPWRPMVWIDSPLGPRLVIDSGSVLTVADPAGVPPNQPVLLPSISVSNTPQRLAMLGSGLVVYRGRSGTGAATGAEPCITDGTLAGTHVIKDIFSGGTGSNPDFFTSLGSHVVFFATTSAAGTEPWTTDGSEDGTRMLADVFPGNIASYVNNPDQAPAVPVIFGGEVYLVLSPSRLSTGLYATDGVTLRQVDLAGVMPSGPLAATDSGVFFTVSTTNTREVWFTNGQSGGAHRAGQPPAGTVFSQFRDLWPWGPGDPRVLIEVLVTSRPQLWVSDGITLTQVIGSLYEGASVSDIHAGVAGRDGAAYVGVSTSPTAKVIRIDPTTDAACTVAGLGVQVTVDNRVGYALTSIHSRLFCFGSDPVLGYEPRVIDLCPADFDNSGAVSVQDIFDFLFAWFSRDPAADFNGVDDVGLQDLFDFLRAWFAGC